MTGKEQSEIRVESLSVAHREFPSLVLELTHIRDRICPERNSLIERHLGCRFDDTIVQFLLEHIEGDLELVGDSEIDTNICLVNLLRLKVRVAIDRLICIIFKIRNLSSGGTVHLILVRISVESGGIVACDGIRAANLEQRQPRNILLHKTLVGGDPCGGDTWCPDKAGLSREIVGS